MEWFRRRKAKKSFKKLKEAYDLGYRHARENMQVELDGESQCSFYQSSLGLGELVYLSIYLSSLAKLGSTIDYYFTS